MVTGGEWRPALTRGLPGHREPVPILLPTAGHSHPSMGTQQGKQGWRAALPEGWKIAVGSIPP